MKNFLNDMPLYQGSYKNQFYFPPSFTTWYPNRKRKKKIHLEWKRKKNILHDMALNHSLNKKQIIFLCLVQNEAEIENEKQKLLLVIRH